MKNFTFFTLILAFIVFCSGTPENTTSTKFKYTLTQYIDTFKSVAVEEMNRSSIPASITLSQAILESAYGNSNLALNANNHFGIKCKPDWTGETYGSGEYCYKKYSNARESYKDHSDHICSRKWYADLFNLSVTDYTSWAHGLKKAGYAEDPNYAYRLIWLIEHYKLAELDKLYSPPDTTKAE
jgi:flagellum-specific peptidoglycan hydrolase FlgJ